MVKLLQRADNLLGEEEKNSENMMDKLSIPRRYSCPCFSADTSPVYSIGKLQLKVQSSSDCDLYFMV